MLEKLKNTFDKGVAAVSVKSENLVETSRTKTAMSSAQKTMDAELGNLGRRLYEDWKKGAVDLGGYIGDIDRIMQIERDIEGYRARLEQIKMEESRILGGGAQQAAAPMGGMPAPNAWQQGNMQQTATTYCVNCGRPLAVGSRFCDGCGEQVE